MPARRPLMLAALATALAPAARAQAPFPNRPLRLVSPFNPGGAVDVLNRVLADRLAASLGQPVVVDARPGANTILGAEVVAHAPPDGHTFMITTNSTTTSNPSLYRELPYDAARDFAPISLLSLGSVLLLAPASAPYRDVPGFIAWARALGRPVTYGSWGVGSSAHLYGELLRTHENLPLEHVPYRGEQAAIVDLLGGRLDVTFASPVGATPQLAAGTARALAMTGPQRSAAMPDLPTFAEQGLAGYDLAIFVAAWAPAGTPRPIIDRLQAALATAVADPDIRQRMLDQGQTPVASTPEVLAETVARDTPRWAALIRQSGARVE